MSSIITGLDHYTTSKTIRIFTRRSNSNTLIKVTLDRDCYWFMHRHLMTLVNHGLVSAVPSAVSVGWTSFDWIKDQ